MTLHLGDDCSRRDRDEAARRPLEQQQLDRQHDRRDWCAEHGRHARGCAGDQQRFPLHVAYRERLRDQRPDGTAGHDDRSLSAEWPPRADRNRRGQRLQDSHLHIQPAAPEQDCLDGLGDAVSPDLLASVSRDQANDQRADYRNQDCGGTERGLAELEVS